MTEPDNANGWTIIGQDQGVRFQVRWDREGAPAPGSEAETWGHVCLWVDKTLIWGEMERGKPCPITWDWIDLLQFLTGAWPYLCLEEAYPNFFNPGLEDLPHHPGHLRSAMERVWSRIPGDEPRIEEEDGLLRDFERTHDLAHGVRGGLVPSLMLLRQGQTILAASDNACWTLDLQATLDTLEQLGNGIAVRLQHIDDKTVSDLVSRWQRRGRIAEPDYLAIAANVNPGTDLEAFWPQKIHKKSVRDCRETYAGEGMCMAARMIGNAMGPEQLEHLLGLIHRIAEADRKRLGRLKKLRQKIQETGLLEDTSDYREQGHRLAEWLRNIPEITDHNGRVDPHALLEKWGIDIVDFNTKAKIDAVAAWGNNRCPTIFLNRSGPRVQDAGGARFTLAHEMGHLVMDGDQERPVGDVLGSAARKSPRPPIERRANAFAAELLLPEAKVGHHLRQTGIPDSPESLDKCLQELSDRFGTGHELAAWKIEHTGLLSSDDLPTARRLQEKKKSLNAPF